MFQSFWYGESLSPYEIACIRSFLEKGHHYILYSYKKDLYIPDGVELRDASLLIEPNEYFTYSSGEGSGSHALFSNLFRYKLLAENGGWWVDTDVICLSRDIPTVEIFASYQEAESINGAVLHFPKGHPIAQEAFTIARKIRARAQWGEVGPDLITTLMKTHKLTDFIQPMQACYPIHYLEAMDVLRPSRARIVRERIRGSLFLHLWNEILRREQVDKTILPPSNSLLREIFDRTPIDGWRGEYEQDHFDQPPISKSFTESLERSMETLALEKNHLEEEVRKLIEERNEKENVVKELGRERVTREKAMRALIAECDMQRETMKTLAAKHDMQEKTVMALVADRDQLHLELASIQKSKSWRFTRPLRKVVAALRT